MTIVGWCMGRAGDWLRSCLAVWGLVHGPARGLASVKGGIGVGWRGGREVEAEERCVGGWEREGWGRGG